MLETRTMSLLFSSALATRGSHESLRKEAVPLCLRCRMQRAFSTWFRTGLVLHPPAHCRASVFQLGDLESEQRSAHPGDWSRPTQLCQPCFQGDLTLGDNAVFRFHSLELKLPD